MNIVKKKIDEFLNKPVYAEDFYRNLRIFTSSIVLICTIAALVVLINDFKKKIGYEKVQGRVIECTINSNNTLWSFIGFNDSTEYKTVIEVNNNILESYNKEIYYMCKDKENNIINLEVGTYEGEANSIKKIIDKN